MSNLLPHPRMQLLFGLLSLADLALTWWLLGHSEGQVHEGNPLARWWLERHGWSGLAGFKGVVVVVVFGLVALIARRRRQASGRLVGFGCAVLGLVLVYSAALCRADYSAGAQFAEIARQRDVLDRRAATEIHGAEGFRAVRQELVKSLRARRCELGEAAQRLASTEYGKSPNWRRSLDVTAPGRPVVEGCAANLLRFCVLEAHASEGPEAARLLARRLEREFESTYGRRVPSYHPVFQGLASPDPSGGLASRARSGPLE